MSNNYFFKIFIFSLVFQLFLSQIKINYDKDNKISKMRNKFLTSKAEGIYSLGSLINTTVIAFADLNGDKLTDIISYNKSGNTFYFYFNEYTKNDKKDGEAKFLPEKLLFNISTEDNDNSYFVRNLHVGSFFEDQKQYSFLITFQNSNEKLLNYIYYKDLDAMVKLNISSNILIMNKDINKITRILFYDYGEEERKICKLIKNDKNISCEIESFGKYLINKDPEKNYLNKNISLQGGLAYVDLNGNCLPDIVLSHEENDKRIIEIYSSNNRSNYDEYSLIDTFTLENKNNFGPFVITKINDDKSEEKTPLLDMIIPFINQSKIMILKNQISLNYKWTHNYCEEDFNKNLGKIYNLSEKIIEDLSILKDTDSKEGIDIVLDGVVKVGDFLGTSNPGILVKHKIKEKNSDKKISQISLFQRVNKQFKYYAGIKMEDIMNNINPEDDELKMGLFFDIDESGTLSLILSTKKSKNYFFFNKRNIYFLKSKLMNSQTNFYDTNLGATFRYIVTDKSGNRHMDVSYQLAQTSDMNIPLPYSLSGLDDTNNYVEYFQTISGNYLPSQNIKFESKSDTNWKTNTPIIPNTQMMISKFYNKDKKIEWNVDLIVQPMEQIWLFLFFVVGFLLIVLGIIIYLHIKELKEEQKETTKFKSWFA